MITGKRRLSRLPNTREMMGVGKDGYPKFRDFNQRVIEEIVAEINRVSDFLVSVDYQRHGRKVTAVKFKIRRVALLPEAVNGQGKLFPDLEDMPQVVKLLKDAGLSSNDAWDIYQRGWAFVVDGMIRPANSER